MFMLGYEIAFWCCLVWQGGWNLNKNISVCRKCLLQQGKWWVGVKYEEQEDNLDGNIHGPDLDSVYCSMVFLGSEHLPLTVAALVHRPFIWRCPIPPAEPAYLGWNLRIIPKLGFCLVPSLGLRREKSLGFFAFLTSYKFCGSSLGANCPVSQVETPQQLRTSQHLCWFIFYCLCLFTIYCSTQCLSPYLSLLLHYPPGGASCDDIKTDYIIYAHTRLVWWSSN